MVYSLPSLVTLTVNPLVREAASIANAPSRSASRGVEPLIPTLTAAGSVTPSGSVKLRAKKWVYPGHAVGRLPVVTSFKVPVILSPSNATSVWRSDTV